MTNKRFSLSSPIAIIIISVIIIGGILLIILLWPEYTEPSNAEMQAELSEIKIAAQEYYNANGSYIGFTTDLILPKCSDEAYTVQISPDGKQYLSYARLCWSNTRLLQGKRNAFWCVDSEGSNKEVVANSIPNDIYICPSDPPL